MPIIENDSQPNIVQRLKAKIRQAKQLGLIVRVEPLEDGSAGWCQMGAKRMLFIDASQTAAEQLSQLVETLEDLQLHSDHPSDSEKSVNSDPQRFAA